MPVSVTAAIMQFTTARGRHSGKLCNADVESSILCMLP